MKCIWCRAEIRFAQVGQPCAQPGRSTRHKLDSRHTPTGDPCACGMAARDHRVSHKPIGDPCAKCTLPRSSHVARDRFDRRRAIANLAERDGWKCQLCGVLFERPAPRHPHPMSVQIDHIVWVANGGTNALKNLRLAHKACNMHRQREGRTSPQRAAQARAGRRLEAKLGILFRHPHWRR